MTSPLTLRSAHQNDETALSDLAALDSQRPLTGDILLAEDAGTVVAALSVSDGRAVADPFRPTAHVVALLRTRAQQSSGTGSRARFRLRSPRLAFSS